MTDEASERGLIPRWVACVKQSACSALSGVGVSARVLAELPEPGLADRHHSHSQPPNTDWTAGSLMIAQPRRDPRGNALAESDRPHAQPEPRTTHARRKRKVNSKAVRQKLVRDANLAGGRPHDRDLDRHPPLREVVLCAECIHYDAREAIRSAHKRPLASSQLSIA